MVMFGDEMAWPDIEIDENYLGLGGVFNVTDLIGITFPPFLLNASYYANRPRIGQYAPKEVSSEAQIILITVYTISIILALFGNAIVIVVLALGQRSRTELSIFLINLAVADLSMAIFCMPFSFTQVMLARWLFGDIVCRLALFMQVASVAVSIFTNMAIGIDRFWAVKYPLRRCLTKYRAKLVIAVIWFSAISVAFPQLVLGGTSTRKYGGSSVTDCNENWPTELSRHVYTVAIAASTYVLPLLVLSFTYYQVGMALWETKTPGNAHELRDLRRLKSKRKIVKMLLTLVGVFAACWFPLQLFNILMDFYRDLVIKLESKPNIFLSIYFSCHWLAMANSFTNPLIYGFLNKHFRDDLVGLLSKGRCSSRHHRRRNSAFAMTLSTAYRKQNSVTHTFRPVNASAMTSFARTPSLSPCARLRYEVNDCNQATHLRKVAYMNDHMKRKSRFDPGRQVDL